MLDWSVNVHISHHPRAELGLQKIKAKENGIVKKPAKVRNYIQPIVLVVSLDSSGKRLMKELMLLM